MGIPLLEINDIQLRIGLDGTVLGSEPGWALCTDPPLLGEAARGKARRQPRLANSQFWHHLTIDPMPGATEAVRHHADLAFLQLQQLRQFATEGPLAIAIPAHYAREDMQLLLGLAEAANIQIKALIDPGVLLAQLAMPESETVLYLDASLYALSMTTITQGAHLQRLKAQLIHSAGYQHTLDRLASASASRLIQSHRFDPMHQAETEQQLFDQLYERINASEALGEPLVSLYHDAAQYDVRLSDEDLRAASAEMVPSLVKGINAAASGSTEVLISHRAARLSGLAHGISLMPGITLTPLSSMALFEVFDAFQADLQSSQDMRQLILSRRNPKDHEQDSKPSSTPRLQPTHVLQNGLAIALERFIERDDLEFTLSKTTKTEDWQITPGQLALSINQKTETSIQPLIAGDIVQVGRETFQFIKVG